MINCLSFFFLFLVYLEHFDFPTSSFHSVSVPPTSLHSVAPEPPSSPCCCPGSVGGAHVLAAEWLSWGCALGGLRDLGSIARSCRWPQAHALLAGGGVLSAISSGTVWTSCRICLLAAPHHHPGITSEYLQGKLLYNSWVYLSWKRPSRSSPVESHKADK